MLGNSIGEFIDDLLLSGGPEKELVYHNKYYFLETTYFKSDKHYGLCIDEYDNTDPENKVLLHSYNFTGYNFNECVNKFEVADIFDGLNIYQAEKEIEVIFG